MTITYRTTGAWGAGKGSNLTAAEVDGNFYDLDQRIADLEAYPTEPNDISNITASGTQVTVTLDDATEFTFDLPQGRGFSINSTAKTVDYTLAATDHMTVIQMTSASALLLNVPLNATVAIGVGTQVKIVRMGAGTVTITPISGVTLYSPYTATAGEVVISSQYQAATLTKLSTDGWLVELGA